MTVIDPATGAARPAEIFIAVMGASNMTYAEASWSQALPDWIGAHTRAFATFGAVPALVVSDNLKSGVIRACFYEPEVNRSYAEMAAHYGTAILPARPYKPRDKAKVEVAVLLVQRWIVARLRNRQFFSLEELNAAIAEEVARLNARVSRHLGASRQHLFETIERPAMQPLPPEPFVHADWRKATVGLDYHVRLEGHHYSVPHELIRQKLWARLTASTVEIFRGGKRVACHRRAAPGDMGATTLNDHRPASHRRHAEVTPEMLRERAARIGPATAILVDVVLRDRPHPEQGFRSCLGILRLARSHGAERLEAACDRALAIGAHPDLGEVDPAQPSRRPQARSTARGAADPPRQHPWPAILPLTRRRCPCSPTPPTSALNALKLDGMAEAFAELITQDRGRSLDPVAWIGLMLDREQARRGTRRFQSRRRAANLRHGNACMEDVDYRTPRGLDRALFQSLDGTDWIEQHRSVLITGPCGVGKSLARLRARPCREPRRPHRPLSPAAAALRRPRARARRRALRPAVPQDRPRRPADPGRLGPRAPDRSPASRPDGDRRGALRPPLHHRHQPAPGGDLARGRRRAHLRRRHPRPARPQRLPHRPERRKHAKDHRPTRQT